MSANESTKRSKWAAWRDTMLQSETWRVTVHFKACILVVPCFATSSSMMWDGTRGSDHRFVEFVCGSVLLPICIPWLGLYAVMVNFFATAPAAFLTFAFAPRIKTALGRWLFALCGLVVGTGWAAFCASRLNIGERVIPFIVIGALAGFLLGKITTALWCRPEGEPRKE